MPGGAADTAGNHYEHLWTVLRIAHLLEGRVSRIRPEPLGSAGTGIELEVDIDGVRWGEQTKDDTRNWTINLLIRERVLAAAKFQIDRGIPFRFIASSGAGPLATLAYRARKSESFAEFAEALRDGRRTHLAAVAEAWQVAQEDAWILLQKVDVAHQPMDALEEIVDTTLRRLFVDDPGRVIAELRSFCEELVHERFMAPRVNAYLESRGLRRRRIVGDTNVISKLRQTRERHRRWTDGTTPRIGLVPRDDVDTVLNMLRDPDGDQIVVVDGGAGSGKSTVVAEVAATLEQEDWYVAVARMDTHVPMPTSDHLGRAIGLTESPSVLLAGVSGGLPALLVVDQLDAVSMYSGRKLQDLAAVSDILTEIGDTANVRVLLVVRTVDLETDPRLRSLLQSGEGVGQHTVGDLDVEAVRAQVLDSGMQLPVSDSTIDLLCRPLHLSVFCRLPDSARDRPYTTLQDLYAAYTEEVRLRIFGSAGELDWNAVTREIVRYMSDRQVLTVPVDMLVAASPRDVRVLTSEGVVVCDKDEDVLAFFHESYFDYLFARSFVAAGRDLRGFLLEGGQFLFRRAQTRQVLEHLAATDRDRFIVAVVDLLECDEIRFRIKGVIVNVLRQIEPTPEDWIAVESLAWSDSRIGSKLLTLLNRPGWFDAADSVGRWEDWLDDPQRVDAIFQQLASVARERPARVAELVRPHIGESEDWRRRLCLMFFRSLSSGLVDLAVDFVERGELDEALGPLAEDFDFWLILHALIDEDPVGAARLIGTFLHSGLVRAQESGAEDPFQSGHLSAESQAASVISDASAGAPAEFVDRVLPFVVTVAIAGQHRRDGRLPRGRRWGHLLLWQHPTVDESVFAAVDDALRALAIEDPAKCLEAIELLRFAESHELRFLACRALTDLRRPDDAIGWLVSDRRNLALGWADSPRWASRELIQEHSSTCSADLFERLESLLLNYLPSWENSDYQGHSQYELLSALDTTRMSQAGQIRLRELAKLFPDLEPQAPQPPVARVVESPISEDASVHMSDDEWLHALRTHSGEQPDWSGRVPLGGAHELARVLGQRAKDDPERFARLALRFDEGIPTVAMSEIIRNVEGSVGLDALTELCERAHRIYGSAVGQAVCSSIARVGRPNDRLVALLRAYAQDADPDQETARTEAPGGEYVSRGDLFTAGLNSTRGQAALAVASTLFKGADHADPLRSVVEDLAQDRILAVRVCAAEAVLALLAHRPTRALDLAEQLFDAPIQILDADTSQRLLAHVLMRDPGRFTRVLAEALTGPDEVATRAGVIWVQARWRGVELPGVVSDLCSLPTAARRGAAQAFATNAADSVDELLTLLDEDDPDIRVQVARAIRNLDELAPADQEALIDSLVSSPTFANQMANIIQTLQRMPSTLPANTITVCERVVDVAGAPLGDLTTGTALIGYGLIPVVLRLYRQGDDHLRERCLNIIDRLAEFSVIGVEEALVVCR